MCIMLMRGMLITTNLMNSVGSAASARNSTWSDLDMFCAFLFMAVGHS